MKNVTDDNESWAHLTSELRDETNLADVAARKKRTWQSYHQAESVSAWLVSELRGYLGEDADIGEIIESVVDGGLTFLDPDDVVSTGVLIVSPHGKRRAPEITLATLSAGLMSPVALFTLAADRCEPGDMVIIRLCLPTGTTYRRQLMFPFSVDEAVAATAPVSLMEALVQESDDAREDGKMRRRLITAGWIGLGAALATGLLSYLN